MSKEEVPFKSMKITLSEEAIDMLDELRKRGAFRSYSMTIEECIRAMHDISVDLSAVLGLFDPKKSQPNLVIEAFRRYSMRLLRFLAKEEVLDKKG